MKKHLLKSLLALALVLVCGNVWGETVTYTFGGTNNDGWTVVATGEVPTGSTAIYTQTYTSTACQMTKDNSITLTLSGYAGYVIKSLTMSMHSNSSSGTGKFSFTAGGTILAAINSNTGFNQSAWYGAWSNSYVDVKPEMSKNDYIIKDNENVVLTISASANSLYCQSITIVYEGSNTPVAYTVTLNDDNSQLTEAEPKAGVTLPSRSDLYGYTFAGWSTTNVTTKTTIAPTIITAGNYQPTANITLYPVFSKEEQFANGEQALAQTLQYDTWTYSGSTTDKSTYRLFHSGSYIESAEFDLSTLVKVVVYGGTFGGANYNSLTISDGTNTWKSVTVSGNSEKGTNEYTDGTALSGTGKLRITSNSGTSSSNGVRISKVEIYVSRATIYISDPTGSGQDDEDDDFDQSAQYIYELVTDASTLAAGDVIILASKSNNATAGDISNKIMKKIESTFNGNTVIPGDGTVELTLGRSSDAWTMANKKGEILSATKVKELAWGSETTTGDNVTTTWSISIEDEGNATIANAYGHFFYNAGSPRFTTYQSDPTVSMLLPEIYRKVIETVSVSSYGYATASFSSNVIVPAENTVFSVTLNTSSVTLTPIAAGEVIGANVGVMVYKENGGDVVFAATNGAATVTDAGLATGGKVTTDDYILGINTEDKFCFCHPSEEIDCAAGKAFLKGTGNESNSLRIEGATMIESLSADMEEDIYFDLQGRKVENPTAGLYIHNGKKILVK